MLDSIYHMALTLLKIAFLAWKHHDFAILFSNVIMNVITLRY